MKLGFKPIPLAIAAVLCALVLALYDYNAKISKELSFRKGDKLVVFGQRDENWWEAELAHDRGRRGYIPSNYVRVCTSLEAEDWFHGCIGRDEAEKRISHSGRDGNFLIRNSESNSGPDNYTLSVLCNGDVRHVHHYRIESKAGRYFIRDDTVFESLLMLVAHHKAHADGLCAKLTEPCKAI